MSNVAHYILMIGVALLFVSNQGKAQIFCDTLVSAGGKKITVREYEVFEKEVAYKVCSELNNTVYFIPIYQVQGVIKSGLLIPVEELITQSQYDSSIQSKLLLNSFHMNFGLIPHKLYYSFSGYYEKIYPSKKEKSENYRLFRLGFGIFPDHFFARKKGDNTPFITGQIGFLIGPGNHRFEAGAGLFIVFNPYALAIPVTANLGYRYQKPEGKLMVRTGVNWPEGWYAGAGYCF